MNNMIAEGEPGTEFISYPAELTGLQRLSAIENARAEVGARLDMLRNVGRKIMLPANPLQIYASEYFDTVLDDTPYMRDAEQFKPVRYIEKIPQDMNINELLAALNIEASLFPSRLIRFNRVFIENSASKNVTDNPSTWLRQTAIDALGFDKVPIPAYISSLPPIPKEELKSINQRLISGGSEEKMERMKEYSQIWKELTGASLEDISTRPKPKREPLSVPITSTPKPIDRTPTRKQVTQEAAAIGLERQSNKAATKIQARVRGAAVRESMRPTVSTSNVGASNAASTGGGGVNLDSKSRPELLELAKSRGLTGYSKMNKPELRDLLNK
jgi:hypothetical protein